MSLRSSFISVVAAIVGLWSGLLAVPGAQAQETLPTPDQLDQLLAPIALYPDALVAQICAASTNPQQILDANGWLQQNSNLTGQARTDAAQAQGFDPAIIALVNFPQVLEMMAQNINDYAAIGLAFQANQGTVMDSVQRLRQQAYAAGALQSNQYQSVDIQDQAVVIQPTDPNVVYIPQFDPQVVYVQPNPGAYALGPLVTFGAGIALGSYLVNTSSPWGWGGWGWNWGGRTAMMQHRPWVVGNRARPPWRFRPPVYNRPVFARPPPNWRSRPFYRPPAFRPGGPGARPPGFRPPPAGFPGFGPGASNGRPSSRPPSRPNSNFAPSGRPSPSGGAAALTRPPRSPPRGRPDAGFPRNPGRPQADYGGRGTAFSGGNNAAADQAAGNRGRASRGAGRGPPTRGQP